MRTASVVAVVAAAALIAPIGAQTPPPPALDQLIAPLRFRSIGPANTGGRVDDFAVARVPGSPDAIYVATASGGVFKSTNQGTSWTPVFDQVDAMMSIGDVAVAPSNANIVWAGTGEANNRQSSSWGDGVYKSTDAGRTWKLMGLRETRHIGRIVVHPTNPDVVYIAAVGHLWGPNAERGVFKTTNGGTTWAQVLAIDSNTGATDIALDPQDPETLYAATYQRQRKAWGFNGGGPGSGIYRTRDGGATWVKLTEGLPKGDKGRIGLDIFQADGRVVFATVEAGAAESGVYRSENRGDTWEQVSPLNPRPMYFSQIRIDPRDRNRVYLLGSNRGFYVSDDGGRNFRDVFSTIHSEDHALWIDPDDTNHLIVGGDGGVSISWDRGATWLFRDNLPIGQFYEISADMSDPYVICGGLQDNGHWCVPSATRNRNGISNRDGFNIGSGDGFYTRIDPSDAGTVVVESQEGRANRVNLTTLERQAIAPAPLTKPGKGDRERWNWNTPIVMSAADPKVLYIGSSMVFRSADRGMTWQPISPDLTWHIDRDTLQMMGSRVADNALSRHDGQTSFSTLTTIGESPLDPRVLYTGSDDGRVFVTRDGGRKWTDISGRFPSLPPHTYVSSILASRHAAGRVYATFDNHYDDDYRAYAFVSDDFGETWRKLGSAGMPDAPLHRLREHPRNPRLLFLGHERGLQVSIDGGSTWTAFKANLPNVPVDDLLVHPRTNDLILGTHGRSLWVLDDLGPLEALTPDAVRTDAFLVPPHTVRLLSIYSPQAWYGAGQFFAPNPEFGAVLYYYVRDAQPQRDAEIVITGDDGMQVRSFRTTPRPGLNRLVWDLRFDPPVAESEREPPSGFGGPPVGPLVLPGSYSVNIALANGRRLAGQMVVESDPRVTFSLADRRRRQSALMNLYELQKTLSASRTAARAASDHLSAGRKDAAADKRDRTELRVIELMTTLTAHANNATTLSRAIEGYSGVPTADQERQIDWLFGDARGTVEELNRLLQHVTAPGAQPIPLPAKRALR